MSRLIAIAVLMVAVAGPAFACDWNKSAADGSGMVLATKMAGERQVKVLPPVS